MPVSQIDRFPVNPVLREPQIPSQQPGQLGPIVENDLKKTIAVNAAVTSDNRTPTISAPRLSTEAVLAVQYVNGAREAQELREKTNPFVKVEDDPLTPIDESADNPTTPVNEEEDLLALEEDDPTAAPLEESTPLEDTAPDVSSASEAPAPEASSDDANAGADEGSGAANASAQNDGQGEAAPAAPERASEDRNLTAVAAYQEALQRAQQEDYRT